VLVFPKVHFRLINHQTDILGAAAAAAGLLEGAIRLLSRLRNAYDRQKNMTEVLEQYELQINSINDVASAIIDEDALQTALVARELVKIQTLADKLVKFLKRLDPKGKGIARQLAHQLVHGTKDEETLADIMTELDREKASLVLSVQLANVGLTRVLRDTVQVNTTVVDRIDQLLTKILGEGQGLKMVGLLKASTQSCKPSPGN